MVWLVLNGVIIRRLRKNERAYVENIHLELIDYDFSWIFFFIFFQCVLLISFVHLLADSSMAVLILCLIR